MKRTYTVKPILASTDLSFEEWKRSIQDYFDENGEYEEYMNLPNTESKWRRQYEEYLTFPESTKRLFPAVYRRLFPISFPSNIEEDYEKDYGPSNPWDAPGMSTKDFI